MPRDPIAIVGCCIKELGISSVLSTAHHGAMVSAYIVRPGPSLDLAVLIRPSILGEKSALSIIV